MNKCDLPEEERPLKMVDFVDILSSNPILRASPHLKTSLLPQKKQVLLANMTTQIRDDILAFARRNGSQSSPIDQHVREVLGTGYGVDYRAGAGAGAADGIDQDNLEMLMEQTSQLERVSSELMK